MIVTENTLQAGHKIEPTPFSGEGPQGSPLSYSEHDFLQHPLVRPFWPSERRAMLVHRFFLSMELRRQAAVEEVVASWERGAGSDWRRAKMRRDCEAQSREILVHKWHMSQTLGRDVGEDVAAKDWIDRHAKAWREWWEGLPESGA